jgi:hypothetical protein
MCRVLMPIQKVVPTYLEDMKFIAHLEPGHPGARRRR